ncbi:MAG: hypothetical protein ACI9J2_002123 [Saprospiraceae bacterium]
MHKCGQFGGYLEPGLEKQNWQKVYRGKLKPSLGAKSAQIEIVQSQRGNNHPEAIWDDISFSIASTTTYEDTCEESTEITTRPLGDNYLLNSGFNTNLQSWLPTR